MLFQLASLVAKTSFRMNAPGVSSANTVTRRSINASDPVSTQPGRTPGDVFAKCLEVRQHINVVRQSLDLEPTSVPPLPGRESIRPRDVFFQTQIIIAELNLLKESLATKSSSPLTIPVTGKTPTHVYEQATMILYLLKQVKLPEAKVE